MAEIRRLPTSIDIIYGEPGQGRVHIGLDLSRMTLPWAISMVTEVPTEGLRIPERRISPFCSVIKFLIQMWPSVAYCSVSRETNLLKRLVDLRGFEPLTS